MRKQSPKLTPKINLLLGLVLVATFFAVSFLSFKGTFDSTSNLGKDSRLSIALAQGSAQISFSKTDELIAAYDANIIPAFRTTLFGLRYFAVQGNIHAAVPRESSFPIYVKVGQGSVVVDTGETRITSTFLDVGQGSVLIVPSNRVSSQHNISIKQGKLSVILPYGIDGLRIDTTGRRMDALDKVTNYEFVDGGYQSLDYQAASIKTILYLSGAPELNQIKLITKEETKKAYFGK